MRRLGWVGDGIVRRFPAGGRFTIAEGDATSLRCDVLAVPCRPNDFFPPDAALARAVLQAAGPELWLATEEQRRRAAARARPCVTRQRPFLCPGFDAAASRVAFLVGPRPRDGPEPLALRAFVLTVLEYASGIVVFTLVSTGPGGAWAGRHRDVLREMTAAVQAWDARGGNPAVTEVVICVMDPTDDVRAEYAGRSPSRRKKTTRVRRQHSSS